MSQISIEDKVRGALLGEAPANVFSRFTKENDLLFLNDGLNDSRKIIEERTSIYDVIISDWFKKLVGRINYSGPIACIAHGGYGRREMTPYSDVDIEFIGRNEKELEEFERALSEETEINERKDPFFDKNGFSIHAAFHTLESVLGKDNFDARQVNSLCDFRVIYDRENFAREFIAEVMKHRKVFSHLDYLVNEWKKINSQTKYGLDNLNSFNVKEDMGGLRHLQLALRIPHIVGTESLRSLYPILRDEDSEVMQSYDFLLKVRGFIHTRKKQVFEKNKLLDAELRLRNEESRGKKDARLEINHKLTDRELIEADTLNYSDYIALGEVFGTLAQKRLLESRKIIANYADLQIGKFLKRGFSHSGFTYGSQGLFLSSSREELDRMPLDSKLESLFGILKLTQTQSLPIDFVEFLDRFGGAEEWVRPSRDFAELFHLEGDIPKSLEFLNRINAYNGCIPGAEKLEIAIPKGGHRGDYLTSSAFGRQKVADHFAKLKQGKINHPPKGRFNFSEVENLLSLEEKVAILMSYQTARTPQIEGKSAEEYYSSYSYLYKGGFSQRSIDDMVFISENRDILSKVAREGITNQATVEEIANKIKELRRLNILRTYNEIDLSRKEERDRNNHHWSSLDEVYFKVYDLLSEKNGGQNTRKVQLSRASFSDEQLEIFDELGREIREGIYSELAIKWLPKFVKVKKDLSPQVEIAKTFDGDELHVCSEDFTGLLRLISGKCFESELDIAQVHAYTIPKSNLVFDIFSISDLPRGFSFPDWRSSLVETLRSRNGLNSNPNEILKGLDFDWNVSPSNEGGLIQFDFQTKEHRQGYLYALTDWLYSGIGANIYAVKSVRDYGDRFRVFFKTPFRGIDEMKNKLAGYFERR